MLLLCTSKRDAGMGRKERERGGGEKMKGKKQEELSQCWIYCKMKDFGAVNLLEWKQTEIMKTI